MEVEDFAEGPVGVAVAASAVVFSPQVRRALRRGLVYGVAGVLAARDSAAGFVRGVRRASGNGRVAEGAQGGELEVGAPEAGEPEDGEAGESTRARGRASAPREGRRTRDRGE